MGLDRQMTSHVGTRSYRAPELILCEKDYGKPVDIWASGVIFGELLLMLEANESQSATRKNLFPGRFCFPLSPNKNAEKDEKGIPVPANNDMMDLIIDFVGSPNYDDLSFISDEKALTYCEKFKSRAPTDLR